LYKIKIYKFSRKIRVELLLKIVRKNIQSFLGQLLSCTSCIADWQLQKLYFVLSYHCCEGQQNSIRTANLLQTNIANKLGNTRCIAAELLAAACQEAVTAVEPHNNETVSYTELLSNVVFQRALIFDVDFRHRWFIELPLGCATVADTSTSSFFCHTIFISVRVPPVHHADAVRSLDQIVGQIGT